VGPITAQKHSKSFGCEAAIDPAWRALAL